MLALINATLRCLIQDEDDMPCGASRGLDGDWPSDRHMVHARGGKLYSLELGRARARRRGVAWVTYPVHYVFLFFCVLLGAQFPNKHMLSVIKVVETSRPRNTSVRCDSPRLLSLTYFS